MSENKLENTVMVYVKWLDHHWYVDELTKGEVIRRTKGSGAVVEEAGVLILENDEYVVMAHVKNHNTEREPYTITYDSTTSILKSDIIKMEKIEIKND